MINAEMLESRFLIGIKNTFKVSPKILTGENSNVDFNILHEPSELKSVPKNLRDWVNWCSLKLSEIIHISALLLL